MSHFSFNIWVSISFHHAAQLKPEPDPDPDPPPPPVKDLILFNELTAQEFSDIPEFTKWVVVFFITSSWEVFWQLLLLLLPIFIYIYKLYK